MALYMLPAREKPGCTRAAERVASAAGGSRCMRIERVISLILFVCVAAACAAENANAPGAAGAAGAGGVQGGGPGKGAGRLAPRLDPGDTPATATPLLNNWEVRLGKMIQVGESSGRLSAGEAKRFRAKLDELRAQEARSKRNDILDGEERRKLGTAARALADEIYLKAGMGKPGKGSGGEAPR
jgi:hypothetical protein